MLRVCNISLSEKVDLLTVADLLMDINFSSPIILNRNRFQVLVLKPFNQFGLLSKLLLQLCNVNTGYNLAL